ncbi:MAG: serine hydrolase [Nitrososphaera sp.]|nr:serine hydrolase [Nitrososphaera sp.]
MAVRARHLSVIGLSGAIAVGLIILAKNYAMFPKVVPDWVVYPNVEWQTIASREAGIKDIADWSAWVAEAKGSLRGESFAGENHSTNQWGVALTRGGYLLQTFGDPDYKHQTASVGKAFTLACLQLAIDRGIIKSADDLIKGYWTGEGQLNGEHKYLSNGNQRFLTFKHLATHKGGFPITNGHSWQNCQNYEDTAPSWAKCTGDPDYDNYAHVTPGRLFSTYSSGGYWRLAQALTAAWGDDLKNVIDEGLFKKMGIPADRWEWLSGAHVRDDTHFYPAMPGYGLFLDPPYEINGHVVRGGQWVVISAKDLARFGLLLATRGIWRGERLISDTEFLTWHDGGNGSQVNAKGGSLMIAIAKVTTAGELDVDSIAKFFKAVKTR